MNDSWITGSLSSYNLSKDLGDKEFWIDRMGLFETGWLLFAGSVRYQHHSYGYPGQSEEHSDE